MELIMASIIRKIPRRKVATMQDYKQAAKDFIENEKEFHLGAIPTEQSNPLTFGYDRRISRR